MVNNTDEVLGKFLGECYINLYKSLEITDSNVINQLLEKQQSNENSHPILFASITIFVALFIIVSNAALIIGLVKTWKRNQSVANKIYKMLVIYLCLTDSILGYVVLPIHAGITIKSGSCFYVSLCVLFGVFSEAAGICTILTISIFRFIAVKYPLKYKHDVETKHAIFACILGALIALIITIFGMFLDHIRMEDAKTFSNHWIIVGFVVIFAICSAIFCNLMSLRVLDQRRKNPVAGNNNTEGEESKQPIITLIIISVALAICYLPSCVYYVYCAFKLRESNPDAVKLYNLLSWVTYFNIPSLFNAALNSVIFIARSKEIKKYYKKDFFGCSRQDTRSVNLEEAQNLTATSRV